MVEYAWKRKRNPFETAMVEVVKKGGEVGVFIVGCEHNNHQQKNKIEFMVEVVKKGGNVGEYW